MNGLADADYCRQCRHYFPSRDVYGIKTPACIYILHTHKRRPCPAGNGCTAWEEADNDPAREFRALAQREIALREVE